MGEAKQKLKKLRDALLWEAEGWCFAPSKWESDLVEEILCLPVDTVPRLPIKEIEWMGNHR
jgi:hypothetical protein